jgi:hypothetical protein
MAAWVIITGSGLDDYIYWRLVCTISLNYNQLQRTHNQSSTEPSSLTADDSPHSRSRSTTHSNWTTLTLRSTSSQHGPRTENTALLLLRACLLGFPRDRYPASPLARWLLPSNGLDANHIENTAPVILAACLFERVYLATGFSGSIAQCSEQIRHSMLKTN